MAGTDSGEDDSVGTASAKQARSFLRAFAATNYLLGKRQRELGAGLNVVDAYSRQALLEVTEQLSHGRQEHRARVLAAEVGRLMRSLSSQRLK